MGKKIPYKPRPASEKTIAHLNRVRPKLASGEASFNALFCQYRWVAKNRGFDWAISKKEFRELTQLNCFYCDSVPSNNKSSQDNSGTYTYSGIDRMDNNLGYFLQNCVPCCKRCNVAKNDNSIDEFRAWVSTVYRKVNV